MVGILVSLVHLAGSDYFVAVFVDVVERFEQMFRAVFESAEMLNISACAFENES